MGFFGCFSSLPLVYFLLAELLSLLNSCLSLQLFPTFFLTHKLWCCVQLGSKVRTWTYKKNATLYLIACLLWFGKPGRVRCPTQCQLVFATQVYNNVFNSISCIQSLREHVHSRGLHHFAFLWFSVLNKLTQRVYSATSTWLSFCILNQSPGANPEIQLKSSPGGVNFQAGKFRISRWVIFKFLSWKCWSLTNKQKFGKSQENYLKDFISGR